MVWHGEALTLLGAAWVAGLLAIAAWAKDAAEVNHAGAALVVVAIKWLAVDGMEVISGARYPTAAVMPVVNLAALAGLVVMALVIWLGRMMREDLRPAAWVGAAVLAFAWLNFETLRTVDYSADRFVDPATAKQVAVSVLWAVVGFGGVIAGFAKHLRAVRYAALGLLGVTLVKILFVDLAQVRPVYRILSFLAVGGLLLCVSFVYHRQTGEKREARSEK
jgi:uncharacterized membrane protein